MNALCSHACLCSALALLLSGCMQLHHVQLGDVDAQAVQEGRRFEILLSETGVDIDEAVEVVKLAAPNSQQADDLSSIIQSFQMGPKTGSPVYHEDYADKIFDLLRAECPSGKITGLSSIRETADYPVITGEIVKVTGYCMEKS